MGAFCEDSRVKFPTLMHLMGMGYKYISQRGLFTKYVTIPKNGIRYSHKHLTPTVFGSLFALEPSIYTG